LAGIIRQRASGGKRRAAHQGLIAEAARRPASSAIDARLGRAAATKALETAMEPDDFLLVTIILDSEEHAIRLAETLVTEHLAATVQIPPSHEAWRLLDGQLAQFREWAVRAVTVTRRFDALCDRAAGMSGIVMPGITAVPLSVMHPRFEGWLNEVLRACDGKAGGSA
jgi:uncharacterized protein involved in tolerance to divalent cations